MPNTGLDPRSTGQHSVYHATSTIEMMFHVVTMMPTKPGDPQQVHKKVHVGNDHVHIVWSEHTRVRLALALALQSADCSTRAHMRAQDYRPTTISSHFNDAHIVIYPLQRSDASSKDLEEQLFRVQIFCKPKVPSFGPLQVTSFWRLAHHRCPLRLIRTGRHGSESRDAGAAGATDGAERQSRRALLDHGLRTPVPDAQEVH